MTAQLKPNHHPCCNTLFRYAEGTLSPAAHLFISAHLNLCPHCRHELQRYESAAGLGLESLPPEEMDVSCLKNLLNKIDESGPHACIDVTLPACDVALHRFPDALRGYVGAAGELVKWDYATGHAEWVVPITTTAKTRLLCLDAGQNMHAIAFEKHSLLLVLDGKLVNKNSEFHRGDILRSGTLRRGLKTTSETLCLVVVPEASDKPNLWQCLMAFLFGDRN